MSDDYIERKDAVCVALGSKSLGNTAYSDRFEIASRLRNLPAADVRPVVKAKWEQIEVSYFEDMDDEMRQSLAIASMYCPKCKRYHNEVYIYGNPTEMSNFCPNCGADMRGEQE